MRISDVGRLGMVSGWLDVVVVFKAATTAAANRKRFLELFHQEDDQTRHTFDECSFTL
jgi:hypothetical protein